MKTTLRSRVRSATYRAVRSGRLERGPCRDCGSRSVEAHHPDYRKPLEVIWLCKAHHDDVHRADGAYATGRKRRERPADVIKVAGLTREQVRKLDRLAKGAKRTRSAYVRLLIEGAIVGEGTAQGASAASKPGIAGLSHLKGQSVTVLDSGAETHNDVPTLPPRSKLTRSFDPDA